VKLGHLKDVFLRNDIYTLEVASTIEDNSDFAELNIGSWGARRTLKLAIEQLRAEMKNKHMHGSSLDSALLMEDKITPSRGPRRCGTCHHYPDPFHTKKSCNPCTASTLSECPTQWREKHNFKDPEIDKKKEDKQKFHKQKEDEKRLRRQLLKVPEYPNFETLKNQMLEALKEKDEESFHKVQTDSTAKNQFAAQIGMQYRRMKDAAKTEHAIIQQIKKELPNIPPRDQLEYIQKRKMELLLNPSQLESPKKKKRKAPSDIEHDH